MGETVSGRLPSHLVEALDGLAQETGKTRSEVLRDVVEQGVAAERLDRAVEAYRTGQASIGRAAEIAGLPLTRFLDELKARDLGIPLRYDLDDLDADMDWADHA